MCKANKYVVIMAGGGGTRLWPMSRSEKPKQFQNFFGDRSLFQTMYELLQKEFSIDHIFVQVPPKFVSFIMEQAHDLPINQILIEPSARDTGPAFAFAAESIRLRDPDALVGFYYSDHLIQSEESFHTSLRQGFNAAEAYPDHLVLIGVHPQYAHTGLGYIGIGDAVSEVSDFGGISKVHRFIEKPDQGTAVELIQSEKYLWNTGYKVARADYISNLLKSTHDAYREYLPTLVEAMRNNDRARTKVIYENLPKNSFEYAVTEKSENLLVLASRMLWSDVGDWDSVHREYTKDAQTDVHTIGVVAEHGSKNTLLISNHRPIVGVGLENIIVVETHDGVLVMSKERSGEMKKALEKLQSLNTQLL